MCLERSPSRVRIGCCVCMGGLAGDKRSQAVVVDARDHPESSLVAHFVAEFGDVAQVLHLRVLLEAERHTLLVVHPLVQVPWSSVAKPSCEPLR